MLIVDAHSRDRDGPMVFTVRFCLARPGGHKDNTPGPSFRPGELLPLAPKYDPDTPEVICRFIRHRVAIAKASGAVVGISGGIDSAVVAALCVRALGKAKVLGLLMPEGKPEPEALQVVTWLGIRSRTVMIGPLVKAVAGKGPKGCGRAALGNVKARLRMVLLYMEANRNNRLVVGTGNKSELLVGYFTKYGDGGVDIAPLGDLYKTQVRALAADIKVPESIRSLVPTAGLYPGQTDEGELGISYASLDSILMGIELRLDRERIAERAGVPVSEVDRITARVRSAVHKRHMPPIPKLGIRTIGTDWREEILEEE
jgi:NAD+ synthase